MNEQSFSGLTSAGFQQVFNNLASAGWRPTQIQGYAEGNESRFNVIWAQMGGPDWVMHHDMTAGDFSAQNQNLSFGGYHLTLESTWYINGEPRYWAMWEK